MIQIGYQILISYFSQTLAFKFFMCPLRRVEWKKVLFSRPTAAALVQSVVPINDFGKLLNEINSL